MSEIMKYYSPLPIAILTICMTFISAWTFPLHGYIFSKILFILFQYT